MNPERWQRLEELYHRCRELEGEEARAAWLASLGPEDADLLPRLRGLLKDDGGFLDPPALDRPAVEPGRRLGPYLVERRLGRGGMGEVWLARRADVDFEQRVALKVVREGRSPELKARFESERRALARLAHPHIARLLDGGTTEDGIEYLVMEYVEGEPIDQACDHGRFSIDRRLRLFAAVCRAVHAAHQEWIVHRDLKPGNVLVDRDGEPRLLDFGIAKDLEAEAAGESPTRTGQRPLTPEFASPEQIRGGPITTASDVYSLGVLLHHLLGGGTPYALQSTLLHELERAIVETEPLAPSEALLRDPNAERLAAARDTTVPALRRRLRRDLDTIVLQAMAKEPSARYASAAALAEDVRRSAEQLPVLAHAPSFGVRLARFHRRHRARLAAAAVALGLLLAAVLGQRWGGDDARRERRRADELGREVEEHSRRVQSMRSVLEHVLQGANPWNETSVLRPDVLDRAIRSLDETELDVQSERELRLVVGRTLRGMGETEESWRHLQAAVEASERPPRDPAFRALATLEAVVVLADRRQREDWDAMLAQAEEAVAALRPPDPVRVAQIGIARARRLRDQGELESARALLESTLDDLDDPAVDAPAIRAQARSDLGLTLQQQGSLAEADAALHRADAEYAALLDEDHPLRALVWSSHAEVLRAAGRLQEAHRLASRSLDARLARFGEQHAQVVNGLMLRGLIDTDLGRPDRAVEGLERALSILRSLRPEEHDSFGPVHVALARALRRIGRSDDALPHYQRAVEIARRSYGEDDPRTATARSNLGSTLVDLRRFEEARSELEAVLEWRIEHRGEDHLDTSFTLFSLGMLEWESGNAAGAADLLQRSLDSRRAGLEADHPLVAETLFLLSLPLTRLGRHDTALELVEECLDILTEQDPFPALPFARAACQRGELLAIVGEAEEAESRLLDARDRLSEELGEGASPATALVDRSLSRIRRRED